MHMNSFSKFKVLHKYTLGAGLAVALIACAGPQRAQAQSLTLDFQFDGGGTTQAITAGQTYTIDVFATVTGTAAAPATTAQLQQLGIQLLRFAARSSMTGGGAYAVGPVSTTGGNAGVGITAAGTIQNPFNNPGAVGPQGDYNGDGINDLGGATKTTISIAQNSSSTQFGGGSFGAQVGTADSWRWMLEQFTVTPGSTAGKTGTTLFTPTIIGTGSSTWTTDGATTADNITAFTPGTPVTFTAGVVSGNTSVLNMTPATATINSLAGGTNSVGLNVANTNAASAGTYTGAFAGTAAGATQSPTGTVNVPASGNVTETITYAAAATPTAVPVNFSYTITNTANASDVQGAGANKTTAFTVNVGDATADNNNSTTSFTGTVLTGVVAAGGSYRGLESKVFQATGTTGAGLAGGASIAQILAGSNGTTGNQTMSMTWRTRTQAEKAGTTFDPSLLHPTTGIISDVVNLTGIETAGTTTGPFVLDMSYNPALLPNPPPANIEQSLANNKLIYLISLNPATNLWDKAFAENTGNTVTDPTSANYGFQGSFDTFATARFGTTTPTNAQLATLMGAWGVDIASHETWAILDHNSQFAVVPEPSTLMLAGLGLFGLAGLRRRVKKSA
jgi:hypothetical protein